MNRKWFFTTILILLPTLTGCSNNLTTDTKPANVQPIMNTKWKITSFGDSPKFVTTAPNGDVYFGNSTGIWYDTNPRSRWTFVPKSDSIGNILQIAFRNQDLAVSTSTGVWLYQNLSWYQLSQRVADSIAVYYDVIYASLPQPQRETGSHVLHTGPYIPPTYKPELYQDGKWMPSMHPIVKPQSETDKALANLVVTSNRMNFSDNKVLTVETSPHSGLYENGKLLIAAQDIQKVSWNVKGELAVLTPTAVYIQSGNEWTKTEVPYPGAMNQDLSFEGDGSLLVVDNEDHPYGTTPSLRTTNVWRYKNGQWSLIYHPNTFVENFAVGKNGDIALQTKDAIQWYHNGSWKTYRTGQTSNRGLFFDASNTLATTENGLLYKWVNNQWKRYLTNERPLEITKMYWSRPYFQPNGDVLVYMFEQSDLYDLWLYRGGTWTDLHFHHEISNIRETKDGRINVWTDTNATYELSTLPL